MSNTRRGARGKRASAPIKLAVSILGVESKTGNTLRLFGSSRGDDMVSMLQLSMLAARSVYTEVCLTHDRLPALAIDLDKCALNQQRPAAHQEFASPSHTCTAQPLGCLA